MTDAPVLRLWETLLAHREAQQAYEAQRAKARAAARAAYQAKAATDGEPKA